MNPTNPPLPQVREGTGGASGPDAATLPQPRRIGSEVAAGASCSTAASSRAVQPNPISRQGLNLKVAGREAAPVAPRVETRSPQGNLRSWLEQSRIIPSIRTPDNIPAAIASPAKIVFLLCGTPLVIRDFVARLTDA